MLCYVMFCYYVVLCYIVIRSIRDRLLYPHLALVEPEIYQKGSFSASGHLGGNPEAKTIASKWPRRGITKRNQLPRRGLGRESRAKFI